MHIVSQCALFCISLVNLNIWTPFHDFTDHLDVMKYLLWSFALFLKIGLFVFSLFYISLYILDKVLWQICALKILFSSLWLAFHCLKGIFWWPSIFSFDKFKFTNLCFLLWLVDLLLFQEISVHPKVLKIISNIFFQKLYGFSFIFRTMIH